MRVVEVMATKVVVEDLVFVVAGISTLEVDGLGEMETEQWRLCRELWRTARHPRPIFDSHEEAG